jgi:hypothetical protein
MGIKRVADGTAAVPGMEADTEAALRRTRRLFINRDNLRAAIRAVVNATLLLAPGRVGSLASDAWREAPGGAGMNALSGIRALTVNLGRSIVMLAHCYVCGRGHGDGFGRACHAGLAAGVVVGGWGVPVIAVGARGRLGAARVSLESSCQRGGRGRR